MDIIKHFDDLCKEKVLIQECLLSLPYQAAAHNVAVLRLDNIHPFVSGNKWFKLKYNIMEAFKQNKKGILTFGGAYSNHLLACAAACHSFGLESAAIVRGFHGQEQITSTLAHCQSSGMRLQFVSREEYRLKYDADYVQKLQNQYPDYFIIPEGGNNIPGQQGVKEIARFIPGHFTHILVAVGTGTTFTGLRNVLPARQQLLGFAPMKSGAYLNEEVQPNIDAPHRQTGNWKIIDDYHFGGFGKYNGELLEFIEHFRALNHVTLDRVYTGKMMYGLNDLLNTSAISGDASVLCIHTGGVQP